MAGCGNGIANIDKHNGIITIKLNAWSDLSQFVAVPLTASLSPLWRCLVVCADSYHQWYSLHELAYQRPTQTADTDSLLSASAGLIGLLFRVTLRTTTSENNYSRFQGPNDILVTQQTRSNVCRIDWVKIYVPLDTKQIIAEMFFLDNLLA